MKRVVFHITDEMDDALVKESRQRRAPLSAVIREALEEYFERRGVRFEDTVQWGRKSEDSENPQEVAVVAG